MGMRTRVPQAGRRKVTVARDRKGLCAPLDLLSGALDEVGEECVLRRAVDAKEGFHFAEGDGFLGRRGVSVGHGGSPGGQKKKAARRGAA